MFSVAAATTNQFAIFIAGLADLVSCALSMASGEYASVSSQSDSEKVAVETEKELFLQGNCNLTYYANLINSV